ncbi:MAG: family 43 glycosylhydrolase [Calditrichaceae bacterium]|nr:family 43 glycosylhydrolase [Calditrichaceae bacterium]MBN2708157.1 family 43 glycosylhydrolase [Calditrichaceae bacterium]
MKLLRLSLLVISVMYFQIQGQSVSFQTYINPVIPGDHPDPTLTKIGNDFYTSGSSFNPTPKIYHSTDLVHWEVISQPVSASWFQYGDEPGGGIWGGHMVFYNDIYWHFFGRGGGHMYFVTAEQPEGPWSDPTQIEVPAGMYSLGVDNSIFIDEETGKWYLLTKAGQENNHIVELGNEGQPTGTVLDLTWLNPNSEGNPYGWAEGPVMWKYKDYYYYSFAEHLVGKQYVMRSDTLTDDKSAWTIIGENIFIGTPGTYNRPNHIAPVVMLDDSTSWTIAHSYHSSSNWYAYGRQGLLCQVKYDDQDFPYIQYPPNTPVQAPVLPSGGIGWMAPKSDMFDTITLDPHWSHLGYTSSATYSLEVRDGWLYLEPYGEDNTLIQNEGEQSYSIITRVDFEPTSENHEAGLWIINGPETHTVKIYSTVNSQGHQSIAFGFGDTKYEVENTIGSVVWLKLIRNDHMMSGFYSQDGNSWSQIGEEINALELDIQQTQYNDFTGNQQGLYVKGKYAYFDFYVYRDAYTPIMAKNPANQYGVGQRSTSYGYVLGNIHTDDWAMYAGVEFGRDPDYPKTPVSFGVIASSANSGGVVEVWLDSIDTGSKITECNIDSTDSWDNYQVFSSAMEPVSGRHDVYLKFTGIETGELFRIQWFRFLTEDDSITAIGNHVPQRIPQEFGLMQNYPNPFNPATKIHFTLPKTCRVELTLYNQLGEKVATLTEGEYSAGIHQFHFFANNLASGIYYYRIKAGSYSQIRKMILIK